MSGIGNNPTDYSRQLTGLNQAANQAQNRVDVLEYQNQGVTNAYKGARTEEAQTLAWCKAEVERKGMTDMQGRPLQFNSVQEFHDLCRKGGIRNNDGPVNSGNGFEYVGMGESLNRWAAARTAYTTAMGPALQAVEQTQAALKAMGPGLEEAVEALEKIKKLLESGDIEGAVMLLQTTRAKVLESQLNSEITNMQGRNAQIKALNEKLNTEQEKLNKMDPSKTDKTSVDARAAQQKVVSDLKSSIDSLNSESQINMIRVQGLVSKRNEAFELLSNLLSKFQKPIDTIVGNMR